MSLFIVTKLGSDLGKIAGNIHVALYIYIYIVVYRSALWALREMLELGVVVPDPRGVISNGNHMKTEINRAHQRTRQNEREKDVQQEKKRYTTNDIPNLTLCVLFANQVGWIGREFYQYL